MAKDKRTTLSRRIARKSKYTIAPFNIRQLERELTHNGNNSDATRFGAVNLASNETERIIR